MTNMTMEVFDAHVRQAVTLATTDLKGRRSMARMLLAAIRRLAAAAIVVSQGSKDPQVQADVAVLKQLFAGN